MPNFLMVAVGAPYPPNTGGNQRTNLLHRALSEIGRVDLILVNDENSFTAEHRDILRNQFGLVRFAPPWESARQGWWRFPRPLAPKILDRAAFHFGSQAIRYGDNPGVSEPVNSELELRKYDMVVARYLQIACRIAPKARIPMAVDIDDLDTEVYKSRIENGETPSLLRPVLRWNLKRLERILPDRIRGFSACWVSNPGNRSFPGLQNADVLPNIPWSSSGELPVSVANRDASKTLLCVASFAHLPNVEGVDFFLKESWPRIRAAVPAAVLRLIGAHMSEELKIRWAIIPGVDPVGYAPDLRQAYAECAATIAPIFYGGGTNIKVLESLAYDRTCVLSPHAQRGYELDLKHEESVWVAEEKDLAPGCIALLNDPEKRRKMAARGRAIVERNYSFARFKAVVRSTVAKVLKDSLPRTIA